MDLCFKESGTHIIKIEVLDGDMLALPPIEYQLIVDFSVSHLISS